MLQRLPQETNGFLCYKDGTTSVNLFSDFTITLKIAKNTEHISPVYKDTIFGWKTCILEKKMK